MPGTLNQYFLRLGGRAVAVGREMYARLAPGSASVTKTKQAFGTEWNDYDLRDLLLSGNIYRPSNQGGALKEVLRQLGKPSRTQDEKFYPIPGYFNPVKQIVGFYQNTLAGQWGQELRPDDEFNGKPIHPNLTDTLGRVWAWSGLNHKKAAVVETAANHGVAGLRIVVSGEGDDKRVYIDYDDPRLIKWVDLDNRGNCVTVQLEYEIPTYNADGTESGTVKAEETISKYGFSRVINGEEQLTRQEQENPLEMCPYVLMPHEPTGDWRSRHAYAGSERTIYGIDFDLAQLDESILAHIWPYLFATGAGDKPRKFTSNKYTLIYSKTGQTGPASTFDPMVPNLDFGGAAGHILNLVGWLRERQPQMVLNAISLLSGISGETLQQVLKPADAESLRARALYEDAIRRAMYISTSLGIYHEIDGFDLGTGRGTKQAADAAYDDGQGPMAFDFVARPGLPLTPYASLQMAQANVAEDIAKASLAEARGKIGVSTLEKLRTAGYTTAEITTITKEKARQDLVDEEDDEDDAELEPTDDADDE